jgi:DNA-binding CsgD family transcriptional regulator
VRRYNAEQVAQAASTPLAEQCTIAAWAAVHVAVHGEIEEAAAFLEQAEADGSDPRSKLGAVIAELYSCWFGGDWERAATIAREASGIFLALRHYTLWAVIAFVGAEVALERGDPAPALALDPDRYPLDAETAPLVLVARAGGELAARRVGTARQLLERALELPAGPGTLLARARLVDACVIDGDLAAARCVLEQMGADVAAMDRRLSSIVLAQAEVQVDPTVDVSAALATATAMGLPFQEARLRLALGEQERDPKENLTRALALVDQLDAAPWRQRIARAMRRQGIPVPRRSTIAGALTEAEQQIAQLVAEGLKNREIADELCYSIKTVQTYLSRVYEKLGVRSRVELTRALQEQRSA